MIGKSATLFLSDEIEVLEDAFGAPAGYRLTEDARARVQMLNEAVNRNARRALMHVFDKNPIQTFERIKPVLAPLERGDAMYPDSVRMP